MSVEFSSYNQFKAALDKLVLDQNQEISSDFSKEKAQEVVQGIFNIINNNPVFGIKDQALLEQLQKVKGLSDEQKAKIKQLSEKVEALKQGLIQGGLTINPEESQKTEQERKEDVLSQLENGLTDVQVGKLRGFFFKFRKDEKNLFRSLVAGDKVIDIAWCSLGNCLACYRLAKRYQEEALNAKKTNLDIRPSALFLLKSHFLGNVEAFLTEIERTYFKDTSGKNELIMQLIDLLDESEIKSLSEEHSKVLSTLDPDISAFLKGDYSARANWYYTTNNPVLASSWAQLAAKKQPTLNARVLLARFVDGHYDYRDDRLILKMIKIEEMADLVALQDEWAIEQFYGLKSPPGVNDVPVGTIGLLSSSKEFVIYCRDGKVETNAILLRNWIDKTKRPLGGSEKSIDLKNLPFTTKQVKLLLELAAGHIKNLDISLEEAKQLAVLADLLGLDWIADRFSMGVNTANPPPTMYFFFSDKTSFQALRDSASSYKTEAERKSLDESSSSQVFLPDCTIQTDDVLVYAHSSILRETFLSKKAASEKVKEDKNGLTIDLKKYSSNTVNLLLDYLYTGTLPSTNDLLDLYNLAEELELDQVMHSTLQALTLLIWKDKPRAPLAIWHVYNTFNKAGKVSEKLVDFLLDQLDDYYVLLQLGEQEREQLVRVCQQRIEQDSRARIILGVCTLLGCGVKQNFMDAHKLFESSAKDPINHPWANYMLGIIYTYVAPNPELSLAFLRKAAEAGNLQSIFEMLIISMARRDDVFTDFCFKKAREFNSLAAGCLNNWQASTGKFDELLLKIAIDQKNAALLYAFGSKEVDITKKKSLLQNSAAFGCFKAKPELAYHYFSNLIYQPFRDQGFELSFEAAKLGIPFAKYTLGICYLEGYGVEQDIERGTALLNEAHELGIEVIHFENARLEILQDEPEEAGGEELGEEQQH